MKQNSITDIEYRDLDDADKIIAKLSKDIRLATYMDKISYGLKKQQHNVIKEEEIKIPTGFSSGYSDPGK